MEEYMFYGKHYLASFIDCHPESINDLENLKKAMADGIIASGATILSSTEKSFDNNGFTILYLLSESHCSIHTYPEKNALFTDLFTCGETCDYKKYEQIMLHYLKPKKIASDLIIRDENHSYS
jgi:S-adenosylmethionine decarboxylase proenzyme